MHLKLLFFSVYLIINNIKFFILCFFFFIQVQLIYYFWNDFYLVFFFFLKKKIFQLINQNKPKTIKCLQIQFIQLIQISKLIYIYIYIYQQIISEIISYKNYKCKNQNKIIEEFHKQYVQKFKSMIKSPEKQQYPLININDHICAFQTINDFIIVFIITEEVFKTKNMFLNKKILYKIQIPILLIYNLIHLLADVLKSTFKDILNSEKLRNNFSSLTITLDHFLEQGVPLITQKFVLESLLQPQGFLDKIEEVVIGQNQHWQENFKALEHYVNGLSDLTYNQINRVENIRYKEELLFDIIEYYDCIIDKQSNFITSEINGEIKMDCQLSQQPYVQIYLNMPQEIFDYSLHDSALDSAEKFENEKVLSFIPPSGLSSILYYKQKIQIKFIFFYFTKSIKNTSPRVPFDLFHHLEINNNQAKLELKLQNRSVRGIEYKTEDFFIKVMLPNGIQQSEISQNYGTVTSQENVAFCLKNKIKQNILQKKQALIWKVGTIIKDEVLKLNAIFKQKMHKNLKNSHFVVCLKFTINDYSLSGSKLEKVTVKNGAQNLKKGFKILTKSGNYEIRLN
ncbi:hypothetical protein IMG5_161480 [Ichthyophthirius multifiliis]|uniref:MHD domain-containing protein n=1 Tax=Ichthyophthirius multifiliis TaxID=5932 RepID=G0R031_ICHMU|nr:hypothetical protein IMG5_161480 [Ichthyophthirius multifiliis]EGR29171.1 hypothetical protein IMG5_161480 [Ichthyophthirius multifiliis]|eukprot:XP_004030407.1 hypothetical protein IMG5_161480 [Ichthyophthirius multifiliis]